MTDDPKSLGYAGRIHCPACAGDEPIEVEEAWWDGDNLHLLHDDGTELVIVDATTRGYSKEE